MDETAMAVTAEQRIAQLVLRGILPTDAERIVAENVANGDRLLPTNETSALADTGPAEAAHDRLWWFYNPAVEERFRRLLSATVQNA